MRNSCGSCVLYHRKDGLAWRTRRMSDCILVLWWYSPISLRGWQARLPACKPVTLSSMTCLPCLFVIVWSRPSSFFAMIVNAKVVQGRLILDPLSHIHHFTFLTRLYWVKYNFRVQTGTRMEASCKLCWQHFYPLLQTWEQYWKWYLCCFPPQLVTEAKLVWLG
jgi:hypothetical protein